MVTAPATEPNTRAAPCTAHDEPHAGVAQWAQQAQASGVVGAALPAARTTPEREPGPEARPSNRRRQRSDRLVEEVAEVHDSTFAGQQRDATGECLSEPLDRNVEGRGLVRQE